MRVCGCPGVCGLVYVCWKWLACADCLWTTVQSTGQQQMTENMCGMGDGHGQVGVEHGANGGHGLGDAAKPLPELTLYGAEAHRLLLALVHHCAGQPLGRRRHLCLLPYFYLQNRCALPLHSLAAHTYSRTHAHVTPLHVEALLCCTHDMYAGHMTLAVPLARRITNLLAVSVSGRQRCWSNGCWSSI